MLLSNLIKCCPAKMFRVLHYCIVVFEGRKVHKKRDLRTGMFSCIG